MTIKMNSLNNRRNGFIYSLFPILIILGMLFLSYVITSENEFLPGFIMSNNFLLTYLGVFIGFCLTIVTFDISIILGILEKCSQQKSGDQMKRIKGITRGIYKELKQNLLALFVFFVIIVFLEFTTKFNFPYIHQYVFLSKERAYDIVKMTIFFLTLYILYDYIITTFKLATISGIMNKKIEDDGGRANTKNDVGC